MKKCTGCDRYDDQPLGVNSKGEPYLACCPDSNYVEVSAVEQLFEKLWNEPKDKLTWYALLKEAKEVEKQQINKACYDGYYKEDEKYTYDYYNDTYIKK